MARQQWVFDFLAFLLFFFRRKTKIQTSFRAEMGTCKAKYRIHQEFGWRISFHSYINTSFFGIRLNRFLVNLVSFFGHKLFYKKCWAAIVCENRNRAALEITKVLINEFLVYIKKKNDKNIWNSLFKLIIFTYMIVILSHTDSMIWVSNNFVRKSVYASTRQVVNITWYHYIILL